MTKRTVPNGSKLTTGIQEEKRMQGRKGNSDPEGEERNLEGGEKIAKKA